MENIDFTVSSLGKATIQSPISLSKKSDDYIANYVDENQRISFDITTEIKPDRKSSNRKRFLEKAGPREIIYFEPAKVHAAVVTCGGLCPGINGVIRAIVMCLWYRYSVRRISGIRFGYRGFLPEYKLDTLQLNPKVVADIHKMGGTILGSSRGGGSKITEIVDSIERMNINMLFTIGGDGTQRGSLAIAEETEKRGLKLSVVGIPKTIDNDLSYMDKSFGFETAVSHACQAISSAHTEAHDALNGIGIVKVMGRYSGFIAAHTALAINEVNFVLIPEVPFDLVGEKGLLNELRRRLEKRNHAVILVAEGAGEDLLDTEDETDASGNRKLGDIGAFLKQEITQFFKAENIEINLKYIDPSYMIRSAPANPNDSLYCARLGNNAAHAAMAGKTKILISLLYNHFIHLPSAMAVSRKNYVDPESSLWRDVVEATGQPLLMKN
ncbi:MAG: ATP-dependent 6-phosphofructokinase [Chitinispirillia bacterium]|jgi:6-phosphofructokinase 1